VRNGPPSAMMPGPRPREVPGGELAGWARPLNCPGSCCPVARVGRAPRGTGAIRLRGSLNGFFTERRFLSVASGAHGKDGSDPTCWRPEWVEHQHGPGTGRASWTSSGVARTGARAPGTRLLLHGATAGGGAGPLEPPSLRRGAERRVGRRSPRVVRPGALPVCRPQAGYMTWPGAWPPRTAAPARGQAAASTALGSWKE